MGMFWDLYQQSRVSTRADRAATLEQRVERLEGESQRTQQLLRSLIERLEKRTGEDFDREGPAGR